METVLQQAWTKSKVLVKAMIIGFIVLVLQIPAHLVQELVMERQQRQKQAIAEVSGRWAGRQHVTGPVIVVPYYETLVQNGAEKKVKHHATFLPQVLQIKAQMKPEEKHRGIYKVMLYSAHVQMSGSFNGLPLQSLRLQPEDMAWEEAFVRMGISDPKGLNEELQLQWGDTVLQFTPEGGKATSGWIAPLPLTGGEVLSNIRFGANLNINGSEQLLFTPVGKTTEVTLQSSWPHPSFTGNILPQPTTVSDSGFTASWKSLSHNRPYPQQWKDDAFTTQFSHDAANSIHAAAFGTDLFVPVNDYQKTLRSVKYAALCLLLTFAAFFIIETSQKKSVHPFHYALVGLALILFYTLLLSFSEYIGFNLAYGIASICTIALIGWFVKSVLTVTRPAMVLSMVLLLLYVYIFTLLQLQDYSLLLGSIGLFISLAVTMYFSRRIQW